MLRRTYLASVPRLGDGVLTFVACVTDEMNMPVAEPYELLVELLDEDGHAVGLDSADRSTFFDCGGWHTAVRGTLPARLARACVALRLEARPRGLARAASGSDSRSRSRSPCRANHSSAEVQPGGLTVEALGGPGRAHAAAPCLPCLAAPLARRPRWLADSVWGGGACCFRSFGLQGRRVYIREELSAGDMPTGGHLWDGGVVLADWLASRAGAGRAGPLAGQLLGGRSFLELGSGCGLPGIVAALALGGRVLLTDRPEVVPLTEGNLALNCPGLPVAARALDWRREADRLAALEFVGGRGGFDVILLADVLYSLAAARAIRDTVMALSRVGTVLLLAHKPRDEPWLASLPHSSGSWPASPLSGLLGPWFDSHEVPPAALRLAGVSLFHFRRVR